MSLLKVKKVSFTEKKTGYGPHTQKIQRVTDLLNSKLGRRDSLIINRNVFKGTES